MSVITARAIVVASILHQRPAIFEQTFKDGSHFRASDSFVRKFLHGQLSWSIRKATRAAQKRPKDWEDQCEHATFRLAYFIEEEQLIAELYVNSDQTQAVYAPGNRMTWAATGSKQVELVGLEEKRAFTLLVSVAADGTLLPFQAVYQGSTKRTLPSPQAPNHVDCMNAGFKFKSSNTKTYWSNQKTMQNFVNDILAPYFDGVKVRHNRPPTQKSLWQIDVWSVHRSKEFRGWMHKNHPTIYVDYVPGGCTGAFQACDVGIQRPLKLSLRKSYHEDIVQEILSQLDDDSQAPTIDDSLGIVRDRSVRWLWNAYQALSDPALVKKVRNFGICCSTVHSTDNRSQLVKAFEGCAVREWNLSFECLSGFKIRGALRQIKSSNPELWKKLTTSSTKLPDTSETLPEDEEPDSRLEDIDGDDTVLPMATLVKALTKDRIPTKFALRNNVLSPLVDAENTNLGDNEGTGGPNSTSEGPSTAMLEDPTRDGDGAGEEGTRGKRVRKPNAWYSSNVFWRHNDDEDSDDDG